ncbi:tight junction protein ZO-1-like [Salvelinus sp. IW2-2015]|uniref:tight junction protein ZO-1-like n=1 Tax=Salvelinus sp. IW2-2015 TaxID=2691554 RepID=UPI0038D45930
MNNMNDGWYGALKETIQQQQNQLVWVSEGKADGAPDDDMDLHDDRLSYLSAPGSEYSMYSTDSRHTSDSRGHGHRGRGLHRPGLDETLNDEVGLPTEPAITRSSEPVREDPPVIQEPWVRRVPAHSAARPLNRIDPAGSRHQGPAGTVYESRASALLSRIRGVREEGVLAPLLKQCFKTVLSTSTKTNKKDGKKFVYLSIYSLSLFVCVFLFFEEKKEKSKNKLDCYNQYSYVLV